VPTLRVIPTSSNHRHSELAEESLSAPRHWRLVLIPFVVLIALCISTWPTTTTAHPADRLKQHLIVGLAPADARLTLVIGGGILANELVLADLDPNGDGTVDPAERSAWIAGVLTDLRVTLDGRDVPLDPAAVSTQFPKLDDFHLGLSPLVLTLTVPLPATGGKVDHHLTVRDDYHLDRTDYLLDVQTAAGASVIDQGWPGRTMRITFATDPALAGAGGSVPDAARAWGTGGVIGRAKSLLERPKSPALLATLIAVFVLMGALHALQPGHGKTLVAAYLVATKGTPRDALALAGIVTFTHTVSVFALGLATLAASRLFLPSHVIPVTGVLSGLLVAGMGLSMLRGAVRRGSLALSPLPPLSDSGEREPAHQNASPPPHHHHHYLSEDEHARLHLEEALAARRPGVDRRGLVALGVSGGLTPCPDALAILLLAIGINQAGFGMLAILAFSLGLAGVLVAFGLAIALAGPFWTRARQAASARGGIGQRLNAAVGRLAAVSPLVSAVVVLLLGLAMIWRAGVAV
jgi:ABC-type nickel/cobalt efflux system permease component RcnA